MFGECAAKAHPFDLRYSLDGGGQIRGAGAGLVVGITPANVPSRHSFGKAGRASVYGSAEEGRRWGVCPIS
jgi:hypothetical protein